MRKNYDSSVTINTDKGELTGWFTLYAGEKSHSFYEQDTPCEVEFTSAEYKPDRDYLDKEGEPKVKNLDINKLNDSWFEWLENNIDYDNIDRGPHE